ncbi:MAG: ExbD/TolR family protein [Cytophaga sp.]|uniref:ExbD/TolR family protein n=1 Tax=Cytophaga sp. TaxID=29535 RepID=UPI003F814C14
MKIKRRKRVHAGVEASSLSDILFFLMLFFLMVSTLASQNALGLLLPESRTGKTMHQDILNVSINQNKEYYVEGKMISFQDYESILKQKSITSPTATIALRIDKSVSVEELVRAVDVINEYHLRCVIATAKKE